MSPTASVPRRAGAARSLVRLWPRLIVAYALVGLLLYYCQPQISVLLTHAARSLLLVVSPVPNLVDLSGRMLDPAPNLIGPSLLFTLSFPLGFALALPGLRTGDYWRRLGWTFIASFSVSSALLAMLVDRRLAARLSKFDIQIHASWYDELLGRAFNGIWDYAMVLYPFLACVLLARATLNWGGSEVPFVRGGIRPSQRSGLGRSDLAMLTTLLLVSVIELRAQRAADRPREESFSAVAERNPELAKSLIRLADSFAARGEYRRAMRWYRESAKDVGSAQAANARMRQLRGKPPSGPATQPAP